jgi:hypothetical protein
MKNTGIIFIIFSIFLFSFSCERKEDSYQYNSEELIIGEWNWIESVYYYTISGKPYVLNPDTVGYSIKHVYLPDGKFKIYRNDILESSGDYWFDKIIYPDGTESDLRLFTNKDDYLKSLNFRMKNDTLFIDNTEVDDAKKVFVRIQ